jgi:hypothetical protein
MMLIRTKLDGLMSFSSCSQFSHPCRCASAATLGRATIAVICLLSCFTVRACPAKQL